MSTSNTCGCGESCVYEGLWDDAPCWGKVGMVDEREDADGDYTWIHACEGHDDMAMGEGTYKAQPIEATKP